MTHEHDRKHAVRARRRGEPICEGCAQAERNYLAAQKAKGRAVEAPVVAVPPLEIGDELPEGWSWWERPGKVKTEWVAAEWVEDGWSREGLKRTGGERWFATFAEHRRGRRPERFFEWLDTPPPVGSRHTHQLEFVDENAVQAHDGHWYIRRGIARSDGLSLSEGWELVDDPHPLAIVAPLRLGPGEATMAKIKARSGTRRIVINPETLEVWVGVGGQAQSLARWPDRGTALKEAADWLAADLAELDWAEPEDGVEIIDAEKPGWDHLREIGAVP